MGHLRVLYYSLALLVGIAVLAVSIAQSSGGQSRGRFSFILVYSLSIAHLGTLLFAAYSVTNLSPVFDLQQVWALARLVNRVRYVALVIFVHEVAWTRLSRMSAVATAAAVIAGTILLPVVVSGQYPLFLLAGVLLYLVAYGAFAYVTGSGRSPIEERQLRALLIFGSVAAPCVVADILASMAVLPPGTGVVVVDLVPLVVVVFGIVFLIVSGINAAARPSRHDGGTTEARHRVWSERGLSRREIEVADSILAGRSNEQIASRLFISTSTVKKHVNHIFAKLEVNNRWEMIRYLTGSGSGDKTPPA